ncbi:MAG TPA: aminotransferase class III-fold pyridoxal phosphate-dependent enzyme, partial [bacterium]|nr:aminotransferase class III-fold pyridoxal phosphate-dependent enzyme [bacterium]
MPSARTKNLIAQDKQYVWHPFTQMRDWLSDPEPLVITRGQGATLFDSDGHAYLDAVSSLWVTVHGHGHPRLAQ